MLKRATLLAAALATALGAGQSANAQIDGALSIDYLGLGGLGTTQNLKGLNMDRGDVIVKNMMNGLASKLNVDDPSLGLTTNNTFAAAARAGADAVDDSPQAVAGYFSYQLLFDETKPLPASSTGHVSSTVSVTGTGTGTTPLARVAASDGIFRLFWNPVTADETNDNDKAGLCFGNLGGDPLCGGGDQVMLLEGTAFLKNRLSINSDQDTSVKVLMDDPSDLTAPGIGTTGTEEFTGSFFAHINVTTQNRDYVLNEFVDNTIAVDIDVDSSIGTPYGANSRPSTTVVGETAFFGDSEPFTDNDTGINYNGPVNNFDCAGAHAQCDFQAQTSGTIAFFVPPVSEPAPLLLAGLGLGLAGYMTRRRRNAKRA